MREEFIVEIRYDCPFLRKDYDGFPDGCILVKDRICVLDKNEIPDKCPLKEGPISVRAKGF